MAVHGVFSKTKLRSKTRIAAWKTTNPEKPAVYKKPNFWSFRWDAGFCGIDERECLDLGCCWGPTMDEKDTWCFKKNCILPDYDKCDENAARKDCGYVGIDEFLCENRDCCWYPSDEPGLPWCFHKNAYEGKETELESVSEEAVPCAPAVEKEKKQKKLEGPDTGAFLPRTEWHRWA